MESCARIFQYYLSVYSGGAIAFIINMPMRWIEKTLFKKNQKMARPLSLILSILLIIAVIVLVFFVVVPQLGDTLIRLGRDVRLFWPKAQAWGMKLFKDNPEIVNQISKH